MPTTAPRDNGADLDTWNDALRASPGWQDFMRRQGIQGGAIRLSDSQRTLLKSELERAGMVFPGGMQIDPAGNINQRQGMSKVWGNPWMRGALLGGAALATMGAAGFGPLAGVLGGGGGASGAAAGAGLGFDVATNSAAGIQSLAGMGLGGTGAGVGAGVGAGAGAGFGGSQAMRYGMQYGIPIAGQLVNGVMQNRANSQASATEADYMNRALAAEQEERDYRRRFDEGEREHRRKTEDEQRVYSRGQRADYLGRLQPYANVGPQAFARLGGALGDRPTQANAAQVPGSAGSVRMTDPNGQTSMVPAHLVDHYAAQGAKRA